MSEYKINYQFEKRIDKFRLVRAFGSLEAAKDIVCKITQPLIDPKSALLMYGSFVTGVSLSPNIFFLRPPDVGRRSDLDLIIIDSYLFNELKKGETMTRSNAVPTLSKGKISVPLTFPDRTVKDFLKRNPYLKLLYHAVKYGQAITNRRMDIKIVKDIQTWMNFAKPFWTLDPNIIDSL